MKKKSFLTFLFSLVPGCGLMYLGYMKKGLQFMSMFAAACLIGGFFSLYGIDWLFVLFILTLPIIWFYQMFDAMHTVARMKNQGIEMPADDGFFLPDNMARFSPKQNRTVAKIIACVLLVVGSFTLITSVLNNLYWYSWINREALTYITNTIRNNLIPAIVSLVLIIIGVKLLRGRSKKDANRDGEQK